MSATLNFWAGAAMMNVCDEEETGEVVSNGKCHCA